MKPAAAIAVVCVCLQFTLSGAGPSFRPDFTFKGPTLSGWHTLGAAQWRVENGEIVGSPTLPGGGWLVLDRSLQDVGFYASFRCQPGCTAGVLLRAEKTANGFKGVYVSLTGPTSYRVTLDAQGQLLSRDVLRFGGGQMRIAPPPDPTASAPAPPPSVRPITLPLMAPDASFTSGEWNTIEIYLDANIVRSLLNNGNERGGAADADAGNFGPIALHAGGNSEVRFKDVAYKDLSIQERPPDQVSKNFRMQRLSDFYYSWGAGATDVNHDGTLDVVSGPHVYYGPEYRRRSEIYLQLTTNPSDGYTTDAWMQFVSDFTGDGWGDALNCSFAVNSGCFLYVNPKGEPRRWDKHQVVRAYQTEIGVLHDLDGDGKPELVYGAERRMRYARPDPANPTAPWIITEVSDPGYVMPHGVGAGDINGDGRPDVVNPQGWWEQPPPGSNKATWDYHPHVFGRYARGVGGSVMAVYDVNGDNRNDVVTVLAAHGWGLAWFEQKRDARGAITFERHMIMDDLWTKTPAAWRFHSRTAPISAISTATASPTSSSASGTGRIAIPISIPIRMDPRCCIGTKRCEIRRRPAGQSSSLS